MGNAGWVPNLLMYPPGLSDEVCGVAGGGLLRLGWAGKCQLPEQKRQESPLDRQITTPENQASRLSLIPPTPLSKGLVTDFFVREDISVAFSVPESAQKITRCSYT